MDSKLALHGTDLQLSGGVRAQIGIARRPRARGGRWANRDRHSGMEAKSNPGRGGMVKEEDLLGAVVGVGGLCGGVGAGGEGGGIEARGVVVVAAGGAERRERVGVGVAVGVVRERRRGREAGAGLAPAPAEERAGEARADEDDEEDAEAEARQRQRHARRHAGPHRGEKGGGGERACGAVDWCRLPSAECGLSGLRAPSVAVPVRAGGRAAVYRCTVDLVLETTECAVAHSALGLWTYLGLGLGCLPASLQRTAL